MFVKLVLASKHRYGIKVDQPAIEKFDYFRFDVRDRPMSIARVYSDQTLFDEPTRAVMNVTTQPAKLIISKLIPADSGNDNILI